VDLEFSAAQTQTATKLCRQGDFASAIASYQRALHSHPDSPDLINNLAWLLAACPDASVRNGPEAAALAERACQLTRYRETFFIGTLGAAYAEAGRFDDAIWMAQKACALAEKSGEQDLLKRNQELLALYRSHQPYHEPLEKLVPAAVNDLAIPTNSKQ
jgi:Flp pilus assembly protein TadD